MESFKRDEEKEEILPLNGITTVLVMGSIAIANSFGMTDTKIRN